MVCQATIYDQLGTLSAHERACHMHGKSFIRSENPKMYQFEVNLPCDTKKFKITACDYEWSITTSN